MDTDRPAPARWNAANARHHFTALLEAADTGRPQMIVHRNGREYVLVSKPAYDAMKPDLLTVLTSFDFGNEEDELDRILAELRPDYDAG